MREGIYSVCGNEQIADSVFKMTLTGDTGAITAPGQFVNVEIDGLFLRRPISVCDVEGDRLTLIYKAVGVGTEKMAQAQPGAEFSLLTGLGNGYDINKSWKPAAACGAAAWRSSSLLFGKMPDSRGQNAKKLYWGSIQRPIVFMRRSLRRWAVKSLWRRRTAAGVRVGLSRMR